MTNFRAGHKASIAVAAALMLAAAAPVANAVSPTAKIKASISPSSIRTAHGSVGTPIALHYETIFGTDTPAAVAQPFTIQKAVVFFPKGAVANGRFFKSCSASQISRFGGVLSRCPKGSKIGGGTLRALAIQLGVTSNGRVALFNGPGGRSITFNIQTSIPANINESFDAPLVKVHGKFAYRLSLIVPSTLQQIISGVFVGLEDFKVTTSATVRVHGVKRGYIEALSCPKNGKAQTHGDFSFKDWSSGQTASASADATIRCKRR
jgi:hypothetical protein